RSDRDWSSDVCSCDLTTAIVVSWRFCFGKSGNLRARSLDRAQEPAIADPEGARVRMAIVEKTMGTSREPTQRRSARNSSPDPLRSEERRVGKEWKLRC